MSPATLTGAVMGMPDRARAARRRIGLYFFRWSPRLAAFILALLLTSLTAFAQDAGPPGPLRAGAVAVAMLPQDLSAWGMIAHADWVVKAVIVGLASASVLTWTVALAKGLELFAADRRAAHRARALA